jgi:SAM-dependent methyltransferase
LIGKGTHVLDIACGRGRHAIPAAALGARVVAVDADDERLRAAQEAAREAGVSVQWLRQDLDRDSLPRGPFDVVMMFDYLNRPLMSQILGTVAPGGFFISETFLEQQREFGWGPTSPDHLLKPAELLSLVKPFEVILARDVIETIDGRQMALASIVAQRPND